MQEGKTALMIAAGMGRETTVELLLLSGADPHVKDDVVSSCWIAVLLAVLT